MRELKLLYSYEEWKEKQLHNMVDKPELKEDLTAMSEEIARILELTMESCTKALASEEFDGQEELDTLLSQQQEQEINKKYTDLTHQITDLCLNPNKHYVDLKRVGKLQYELERLKYPVVVPKREE